MGLFFQLVSIVTWSVTAPQTASWETPMLRSSQATLVLPEHAAAGLGEHDLVGPRLHLRQHLGTALGWGGRFRRV